MPRIVSVIVFRFLGKPDIGTFRIDFVDAPLIEIIHMRHPSGAQFASLIDCKSTGESLEYSRIFAPIHV